MKNKKWLLIIVGIIFFINITFYLVIKLGKLDDFAKNSVKKIIEENLEADVSIGYFSFNDKQIDISHIEIREKNEQYNLKIDHIYVQYNLLPLLFSGFRNFRSVKKIDIYHPVLSLDVGPTRQEINTKYAIPDFKKFFEQLKIHNGEFAVHYQNKFLDLHDFWQDIEIAVQNTSQTKVQIKAVSENKASCSGEAFIKKGKILDLTFNLTNYYPREINYALPGLDSLQGRMNTEIKYSDGKMNLDSEIEDIYIDFRNKKIIADSVLLVGNSDSIEVTFDEFLIEQDKYYGSLKIIDPLNNDRRISGSLISRKIDLAHYLNDVAGSIKSEIYFSGKMFDPLVRADLYSGKIEYKKQSFADIHLNAVFQTRQTKIILEQAFWEGNKISGNGSYQADQPYNFQIIIPDFKYNLQGFELSGNVLSNLKFKKNFNADLYVDELRITRNNLELADLSLTGNLAGDSLSVFLSDAENKIRLNTEGNISQQNFSADLSLKRFDLNSIFHTENLPILSGSSDLSLTPDSLSLSSSVRIFDKNLIRYDGIYKAGFSLNRQNRETNLSFITNNAVYNYEDFSLKLIASGSVDSLHTDEFRINNDIELNGWLTIEPKLDYGFSINSGEIELTDYLKYFLDYSTLENIDGKLSFDLNYDSRNLGSLMGIIEISELEDDNFRNIRAEALFSGTNSKIDLDKFEIYSEDGKIFALKGYLVFEPEYVLELNGTLADLQLLKIMKREDISGLLAGEFSYKATENPDMEFTITAKDLELGKLNIDSIEIDAWQQDNRLIINKLSASRNDRLGLTAKGAIGYNLLTRKAVSDTSRLSIDFNGDMLNVLADKIDFIEQGTAISNLNMKLKMEQDKLVVEEGKLSIDNGELKLKNQLEKFDRIQVSILIENNMIDIEKFEMRMDDGWLYLKNDLSNSDKSLKIGFIEMGELLFRTNDKGLTVNIPNYMPQNSAADVVITGRDSEFLKISGPADNAEIIGDLIVSNGNFIYPPNIDNLIKFFEKMTETKKRKLSNDHDFPIYLDLLINVGDNIHYVTYPAYILVNNGGYLHLKTRNGKLYISDAYFISESGNIELFDAKLQMDYMQVIMHDQQDEIDISGTFYKKTGDGSLITFELFYDPEKGIQFRLNSDDPTDDTLDIISKLRYNRSLNEISDSQKKSLLQEEVINIAGLQIENALLDPIIYPLENSIRRLLDLDYFQLKTDLVMNIVNRYYLNKMEDSFQEEQAQGTISDSSILFDNFAVEMGKYVTQNIFCDYKALFQRPKDVLVSSEIGVYHYFTVRYDLPYKFRLSYKFNIKPFDEKNSHEIGVQKSIRFW